MYHSPGYDAVVLFDLVHQIGIREVVHGQVYNLHFMLFHMGRDDLRGVVSRPISQYVQNFHVNSSMDDLADIATHAIRDARFSKHDDSICLVAHQSVVELTPTGDVFWNCIDVDGAFLGTVATQAHGDTN